MLVVVTSGSGVETSFSLKSVHQGEAAVPGVWLPWVPITLPPLITSK